MSGLHSVQCNGSKENSIIGLLVERSVDDFLEITKDVFLEIRR